MIKPFLNKWRMLLRKRKQRGLAARETDRWLIIAFGVQVSADERGLACLDTLTGRVFVDNQVAALIWLSASRGLSLEKAAEDLATRFGITQDRAERDIRAFVQRLERFELAVRGIKKQ
jgi:hypothetical protein